MYLNQVFLIPGFHGFHGFRGPANGFHNGFHQISWTPLWVLQDSSWPLQRGPGRYLGLPEMASGKPGTPFGQSCEDTACPEDGLQLTY